MHFENINYALPVQAAQNQQAAFMNALGMGIQAGQQKQAMDLRRRQVEMQEAEAARPKPMDFTKMRQQVAFKAASGQPLSEFDLSIVKAGDMLDSTKPVDINPITREPMRRGTLMDAIMAGGQVQPAPPSQAQTAPPSQAQLLTMDNSPQAIYAAMGAGEPPVSGAMAQPPAFMQDTRGGEMEVYEQQKKIAEEERKQQTKTQEEVQKATRTLFKPKEGIVPNLEDTKSMTKITQSYKILDKLLNDYETKVNKYGVKVAGTAGAKDIGNTEGQIRMQIKNLEELGALQEPDIRAMQAMMGSAIVDSAEILNPISGYTMATAGKQVALQASNNFRDYMDTVINTAAETRGFDLNIPRKEKKQEPKKSGAVSFEEYFK